MPTEPTVFEVIPYEKRLDGDWGRALSEGSRFFEEKSAVQDSLRRIARRLGDLGIPYAVAGGMALYRHGFRRFTEDVDLLVRPEGLKEIHDRLDGLGYVPPFAGSKQLRDTETGVRIEFLVSGAYPGDGKPKPVAFPDPAEVGVDLDGISYVNLPTLVELKLASGMTGGLHRLKDFADVIELIKVLKLPADFADQLNPYVRDRYAEIWSGLQEPTNPEP
jgi:Nucleotidyl transferase AbiEii toxin, Type IV TA system